MNQYAKQIIKHLDHITASGNRPSTIFQDFIDMTCATLEAIPVHLRSAVRDRQFAADTEETAKLFERMRGRYASSYCWEHFSNAFYTLLDSADGPDGALEWDDTIGQVYMDWGVPNKHTGQFFTPYEVARMMAQMQGIEELVYQRLETAYLKSSYGVIHLMLTGDPARVSAFVRRMGGDLVHLCVERFEQIKVQDCACGSGVMLLAAAEQTPRWALDWGLVKFFGQDIDQACVTMTRINMMIYGLNGFKMKCIVAMTPDELPAVSEPAEGIVVDVGSWKQGALL
jgi:hypothetical protein